jgi:outer membrane protein assembly factor BamB
LPSVALQRLLVIVPLYLACGNAWSQEWTRFRGPNGTGESEATTVPATWTDADYNWKIELPGAGHSSPVLWGPKIFLATAEDEGRTRSLVCLDAADGHLIWQHKFPSDTYHIHRQNSFATSTPVVDADRVYALVVSPEHYRVHALSHAGKPLWEADLGPFAGQHGFGTSPILHNGLLIAGNDQDGTSFLFALDCRNGKEVWRSPRKTANVSYSTPCVYEPQPGKPQLIFGSEAHGISSVNPRDGSVNWELPVLDKRSVSSPFIAAGLVFASCGSGGGGNYVVAVRPGKQPEEAYRFEKQAPYVPTSVVRGNLLFLWGDAGIVTCLDAPSGETIWQKRVGGNFSGSPVRVGEHLYCVSAEGDVVVLAAKPQYELLGRVPLGEVCRSTPAVAGGKMYLRTESHLYSLGNRN